MSFFGNKKMIKFYMIFRQAFNFLLENNRINNYTITNYIYFIWMKNSGRNCMQNMLDIIKFKGMTGIWTTLKPGNDIVTGSNRINNFTFSFVSPLKTQ